jgi:hypothetical protein
MDFGRMELARSEARAALDSAVLAGCNAYFASTTDRQEAINKLISANFDARRFGVAAPVVTTSVTAPTSSKLAVGQRDMTVRVKATTDVPATLLAAAGIQSLPVSVESECTRTEGELEVLLVLDTTGSMGTVLSGSTRRIDALRDATRDFINILYSQTPAGETNPNLRVGIMPYSTTVRLRNPTTSVNYLANSDFRSGQVPSDGCVEERVTTPSIAAVNASQSIPAIPAAAFDVLDTPVVTSDDNTKWKRYEGSNCPNATLLPAVRTQSELLTYANNNLNTPAGNTHTEVAMAWATRVLSPALPIASAFPYRDPVRQKFVILMTDGLIEINANCANWNVHGRITCQNLSGDGINADVATGVSSPRTTSQVPEYVFGAIPNNSSINQKLNNRLRMQCNALKFPASAPGSTPAVRVFVVTFGAVEGRLASEEWLYRECATPGDYYNVQSAAQLQSAFQSIASTLAQSRLSK